MTVFRVWAPVVTKVEVQVGAVRIPMTAGEDGWWSADVPSAGPGSDYAFILDGGTPLPDPRSPWQPHGVHSPSRVVDHQAFAWTDAYWQAGPLAAAVIYELHVGTFTPEGTFAAAFERLAHLVDLGVTHVELMPVNEFSGTRGWGYDGVDLYAPHHAYGGPEGLKRFVDACHAQGLAVVLDVVYNHLGPAGSYLDRFGPYFTGRYATPWGQAVNLDGPGSDEVRRFFCDNALMWLRDYHLDGLRLDAVHAMIDTSALHFLEQLAAEVDELEARLGRHLVLIAESDLNDPRVVRPPEIGGYGIDAQWSDDFHHAFHTVLTSERGGYYADFGAFADLAKALECAFVYDGCYSAFRRRRHGRPTIGLSGHRFLSYLQNHDQIGNRAKGDRSSHLMSTRRLKVAAALVLTSPFVPMLFQGEEWGALTLFQYFTDHEDPELGRAVSEGRRAEFVDFGWDPAEIPDPQARETFEHSKLDWDEPEREPHAGLLEWHRCLIRLRRTVSALCDGRLARVRVRFDEERRWLVVERGPVTVACNLASQAQRVPMSPDLPNTVLVASEPEVKSTPGGIDLPPDSVAVLGPQFFAEVTQKPQRTMEVRVDTLQPQVPAVTVTGEWEKVFQGEAKATLEALLPEYLRGRRWFGGKARQIRSTTVSEGVRFPYDSSVAYWTFVRVTYAEGNPETYILPLTITVGKQADEVRGTRPQAVLARVRGEGGEGLLYEAVWENGFCEALLTAISRSHGAKGAAGELFAMPTQAFQQIRGPAETALIPALMTAEQSNTSVAYGERLILKLFRRVTEGMNPDLEIGRFLTEKTSFTHIARVAGALEYRKDGGEPMTVAILQGFVPNQGDAWQYTLDTLDRYFAAALARPAAIQAAAPQKSLLALTKEEVPPLVSELIGPYLGSARLLGRRTAELHVALTSHLSDPHFAPEPFSLPYQHSLVQSVRSLATGSFELLRRRLNDLPEAVRGAAQEVLDLEGQVFSHLQSAFQRQITAQRTRHHGDYHLGQVLYTGTDFVIIDFEGEPTRPLSERRLKHSPLRDVAGMLRSFHYAAYAGLFDQATKGVFSSQAEIFTALEPWARVWHLWVSAVFLQTYLELAGRASFLPHTREELQTLLDAHLLEKAVYELGYELNNRPDWVRIPLQGISHLLEGAR